MRGPCAYRVAAVARFAAPLALLAALIAVALAVAGTAGGGDGPERGTASGFPLYPALRTEADLAAPGPGQTDSGVGVYPVLAAPRQLAFPSEAAVERARRFAETRDGTVAFAVADERGGLSGHGGTRPFPSASLTKAMLLVAFLRGLAAEGSEPSDSETLTLGYMIRISDNGSADEIYAEVGDEALRDLARRAGMRAFEIDGDWANATLTPADQARFFLSIDRLVPRRFRGLALDLLEGVTPLHSWGIPAGARPRWRVFFKGGWRPEEDGELVHQAALMQRGSRRIAIAVFTDANPNMVYGERTIQGVTARLLAGDTPPSLPLPGWTPGPLPTLEELATRK